VAWQIIEAAKQQDYYADPRRARRWVSLMLAVPALGCRVTRFVISLHAVSRVADLDAAAGLTRPLGSGGGIETGG